MEVKFQLKLAIYNLNTLHTCTRKELTLIIHGPMAREKRRHHSPPQTPPLELYIITLAQRTTKTPFR